MAALLSVASYAQRRPYYMLEIDGEETIYISYEKETNGDFELERCNDKYHNCKEIKNSLHSLMKF